MRLDAYLAKNHPQHSRSTWQKFIDSGLVSVNGKIAVKTTKVSENDKIEIGETKQHIEPIDIPIIFEDDNVIVINKPAGVLAHSKGAINNEFTVSDFIKSHSPNSDLPDNNRFGIVHRLDRMTSGVMIGAKNVDTLKKLQRQFSERKTKKTYQAIVEKVPEDQEFRIDLPIARNPKSPSQFRVDAKGKPAVTDVKVNKLFDDRTALLELRPITGRTHQLRVHLTYIGSPIVGDPVYGQPANHMLLHAHQLEITIPDGDRRIFTADPPKYFEKG